MEYDKPSLDLSSSEEKKEKEKKIKNKRKEKGICKCLGNGEEEVPLENKKSIFKLIWKSKASGYLCKVRRCDSYITKE